MKFIYNAKYFYLNTPTSLKRKNTKQPGLTYTSHLIMNIFLLFFWEYIKNKIFNSQNKLLSQKCIWTTKKGILLY